MLDSAFIGLVHELGAIQALLALALLEEEVTLAVPIKGEFSASCAVNTLLGAAMRLELWHEDNVV